MISLVVVGDSPVKLFFV